MNRLSWAALGLAFVVASSGCATIVGGASPQGVSIRSNPSDAAVQVYDLKTGNQLYSVRTPVMVSLPKSNGFFAGASYRVILQKAGYASREVVIDSHPGGWYLAGNLFFGGLIGWLIVDPATGAMWTLAPDDFSVDLPPEAGLAPMAPAAAPPPVDPPAAVPPPGAPPPVIEPAPAAPPVQVSSLEAFTAAHPELAGRLVPILN